MFWKYDNLTLNRGFCLAFCATIAFQKIMTFDETNVLCFIKTHHLSKNDGSTEC